MCDGGGLGAPASCEFLQLRVFGRAVALQPQWFVRIAWLDLVGLDRFASQLGIQRSVCSTSVVICLAGTSKVLPWSMAVVSWAGRGSWRLAGPRWRPGGATGAAGRRTHTWCDDAALYSWHRMRITVLHLVGVIRRVCRDIGHATRADH